MAGILSGLMGGINKAADELINPQSALGKFGAYLGAASGSPLGMATMAAMQDARQAKRDGLADEDRLLERQLRQAQIQKILNPPPVNNDTINDFNFISQQLGEDAGKSFLRNLAMGPPIAIDRLDETTGNTVREYMPRGQFGGGFTPQTPTAPVGKLTPIAGGPTLPASGGFR